jgi:catechol 2,3-dioxygenase-like lactoylglutathione lyase family enzyme
MVTAIHHLTLRVRDLAVSARFYEDALGVPVERLGNRCRLRVGGTVVVLREPLPGTRRMTGTVALAEARRGGPTPSDAYQITRASSANASASRAEGGTSVPRS